MKSLNALVLALLTIHSSWGYSMLRVLKYRSLTEVHRNSVCVYARHEHNPKRENLGHPQNTREPIVCRLSVTAEIVGHDEGHRSLVEAQKIQSFPYETLRKTCVDFGSKVPKNYRVKSYYGMSTECATDEAGPRVFPGYRRSKHKSSEDAPIQKMGYSTSLLKKPA